MINIQTVIYVIQHTEELIIKSLTVLNKNHLKQITNQKGVLTIDFVFALVIALSMTIVFFALMFTLSTVEILQYVTFATARTYFVAHKDQDTQQKNAKKKFDELKQMPPLKPLFGGPWFELSTQSPIIGDFNNEFSDDAKGVGSGMRSNTFLGARVVFTSKMLNMQFPLLGSTTDDPKGFTAKITSYLSREPSSAECMRFAQQRWQALLQIHGMSVPGGQNTPIAIIDDGC